MRKTFCDHCGKEISGVEINELSVEDCHFDSETREFVDAAALWVEINKICDRRDAGIITDLTCLQQILSAVRHAPTIIPAEPCNNLSKPCKEGET